MGCKHDWMPHTRTSDAVIKVECTKCGKILGATEVSERRRKEIAEELEMKDPYSGETYANTIRLVEGTSSGPNFEAHSQVKEWNTVEAVLLVALAIGITCLVIGTIL